jgi:hypothetical protein
VRTLCRCSFTVATALVITAGPLQAQTVSRPDDWSAPRWVGDATFLGLNALSSGLTAGLFQLARGESFADGFARGALGGSVHYAGMRISAQAFDGAGLLGRQVSAAGVSMVRNASDGNGLLERMFVPLGPLHLYLDLADGVSVQPKLNLAALVVLISAAAEPEFTLDAGASLSSGAPVFRAHDKPLRSGGKRVNGFFMPGSIFVSNVSALELPRVLAHERVHVLQGDWLFLALSEPAEAWVVSKIPLGSAAYRYVDIGGTAILFHDAIEAFEIEAGFLDDR